MKIFIEKHGGNIKVESNLGIGTEMTCSLPKKISISDELSNSDIIQDNNQLPL